MRRLPTDLKRLQGTLRKDRMNANEPRPPKVGAITPRRGLPLGVRREFARLVELLAPMAVLTVSDLAMLELTAGALDEYRVATTRLTRGLTYRTKNAAGSTMHRTRPEVAIRADAWRRASAGLQQFGLSPSSRPKVETDVPPARDRLASFHRQRPAPPTGTEGAKDPSRFFRD